MRCPARLHYLDRKNWRSKFGRLPRFRPQLGVGRIARLENRPEKSLVGIRFPKQLRQPRDVDGNPSRLPDYRIAGRTARAGIGLVGAGFGLAGTAAFFASPLAANSFAPASTDSAGAPSSVMRWSWDSTARQ